MKSLFKPVVRNIRTKDIYFYLGENEFENIRTGTKGKVSDKAAQTTFRINPELSVMLNEFPNLATLIKKLDLTIDQKLVNY
jgi:hypothetical protein